MNLDKPNKGYVVIDDFLDEFYIDYVRNNIEHGSIQWWYNRNISKGHEVAPWMHGFSYGIFDKKRGQYIEDKQSYLIPIFLKIQYLFGFTGEDFLRARFDMTVRSPVGTRHTPHVDMLDPHYAGILYMNDSDGDTVIYKETEEQLDGNYEPIYSLSPKKNRLLLFDGSYYHTGHAPSGHNNRILLNFNYRKPISLQPEPVVEETQPEVIQDDTGGWGSYT